MRRIVAALVLALGILTPTAGALPGHGTAAAADNVVIWLDSPNASSGTMTSPTVGGWAIDTMSTDGTGIDTVSIYIDGDAQSGRLLGNADYGLDRPDVAAHYSNDAFRHSGFMLNLVGHDVAPGPHTLTVVAHSMLSGNAVQTVPNVNVMQSAVVAPPMADPATGLPIIGTNPGNQPIPGIPTENPPAYAGVPAQQGPLQLSATLSNASFLLGQNYYGALSNYNGYVWPGLTLPNGTVLNDGTYLQNGQLYYNGTFVPVTQYLSPVTLSPVNTYNGSFNYGTSMPNGLSVPYGVPGGYWNNFDFGALYEVPGPRTNVLTRDDEILQQQLNTGYGYGYTIPIPGTLPGYGYTGTAPWYNNYSFAGNAATQATLVVHVQYNGAPVEGAQVSFNGFQLPATDANGVSTSTVMMPVNPGSPLNGTVTATYNGMSTTMPLVVSYSTP